MKKHKKLISILILFCLVFQLIPFTTHSEVDLHIDQSQRLMPAGTHIIDILYVGKEHQKPFHQQLQNNNFPVAAPAYSSELSSANILLLKISFDYRKIIRQSIPDYFNGSKYKDHSFVS